MSQNKSNRELRTLAVPEGVAGERIDSARETLLAANAQDMAAGREKGLDAALLWPARDAPSPQPVRAGALVERLLPAAQRALVAEGVDESEAAHWLGIVAARTASGRTGACWQRRALARLPPSHGGCGPRLSATQTLDRIVL